MDSDTRMDLDLGSEVTVNSCNEQFRCNLCDKTYRTKKALNLHLLTHKPTKEYVCELCPSAFYRKGSLTRHKLSHGSERRQICEICGKNFKHRSSLLVHKASHNSKPTCQICNKSFTYITGLRRHMKLCTSSDLQACRFCGKKLKQLREHEMFCDSNPRVKESFACLQCNGVFKRKRYLASHIKYAHSNHQYSCEKCPSKFAHRKAFNLHKSKCNGK